MRSGGAGVARGHILPGIRRSGNGSARREPASIAQLGTAGAERRRGTSSGNGDGPRRTYRDRRRHPRVQLMSDHKRQGALGYRFRGNGPNP